MPHDDGQQVLIETIESGQIGVGDQVGGMAMMLGVGDVQTHFVKARRPDHDPPVELVRQPPVVSHLLQKPERRRFDPPRLRSVHVETQLQPVDGLVPGIVAPDSSEHVVQETLAQRAVADLQLVDSQAGHGLPEYHQPAREHRRSPRVEVRETHLRDSTRTDHLADEGFHRVHGQAALDQPHAPRRALRGTDRSRGAHGTVPAQGLKRGDHRLQFEARRKPRPAEAGPADLATVEITAAQPDATHEQAFQIPRLVALADDQFRAAAADVHHQHLLPGTGYVVGHAEIDQPRLLDTGNDFHRVAQRGLRSFQKAPCVCRPPQRIGSDDAYPARVHLLQPLSEPPQAVQRTAGDRFAELPTGIKPRCQPHHLPDPVDDRELPVPQPGDHHVETVGSQIHRGHHGRRFTRGRQLDDF